MIALFDTVGLLLADVTIDYTNCSVGDYVGVWSGNHAYQVAISTASDHHVTTASGLKLYVVAGQDGCVNFAAWGPLADTTDLVTGTDNTAKLQSALDHDSPLVIPAPPFGFAYGITQVTIPRYKRIIGPGQYVLAIRGTSTLAALKAGSAYADLKREITIIDLYVENNRGGDAADLCFAPDINIVRSYFRSVTSTALGTTAKRGLNMKNSERAVFSGQCRFGGNPAFRLVKDCNGVNADKIVVSGGSLGLAVDISGCQNVKIPFTIETSLQGIRIGDNTGLNATEGGWSSGIDLSGSYLESVGTPVIAGHGFAVQGLNLDDCWLNNAALSDSVPFPASPEILKIGRVKNLRLQGGRWVGAGTETALRCMNAVATSGAAPAMMESADVDLTVFENVAALLNHADVASVLDKATLAAQNRVFTDDYQQNGFGVPFEWTSPPLLANTAYAARRISGNLGTGGRITSVELIEGDGASLNGCRVTVGTGIATTEVADVTFGAVNHVYYNFGVTNGLLRSGSDIRFATAAGGGAGKFRLRIRGRIGTV